MLLRLSPPQTAGCPLNPMPTQNTINTELIVVPDQGVPDEQVLIARRPKLSGLGIYYTTDGGKTFRSMIPAPTQATRQGAVLTVVDDKGNVDWRLPNTPKPPPYVLSGQRQYASFNLAGALSSGGIFGYFKIPEKRSATLIELLVSVQTPADQNITVDLINSSGTLQNRTATLGAGSYFSAITLDTPLLLGPGTAWRMKVTGCGSNSAPGEFLNVIAGIEYNL